MYGEYSEMYSRWCDYYDPDKIELQTIDKYINMKEKDILDIGCGTGRLLFRLLPYVKSAVGIDNDALSISILNEILSKKYAYYSSKTTSICSNIENAQISPKSVDIAFFSWSLYALNKDQMEKAVQKVFDILRVNGRLMVLQPIGGEFETIMRLFFKEHVDEDEYKACIRNMNDIFPQFFEPIASDKIVSHFIVPTLNEFCEMLKMFAIAEGGCNSNEIGHINLDALKEPMSTFKMEKGFCLEDEVLLFVYRKREV